VSTLADDLIFPSNLTWDEFLALPHELRNASLIDGEVVVDAPNEQHEFVVQNLILVFREWIRAGDGRGQVSTQQPVKINERRGYQPDFAWYPQDRCAPPGQPRRHRGHLPGLAVEVLSPSTRKRDFMRKRGDYERIGVDEVWFVEQLSWDGPLIACQRKEPGQPFVDVAVGLDDVLTSPLLDGFELRVGLLYEDF
jgi:Uma2 family endonuclease